MSKGWMLLLWLLVAIAAFLYATLQGHSTSTPEGLGFMLGAFLGALVFSGIIVFLTAGIYWLVRRKRMPGISPAILVFAVVLLTALFALEVQQSIDRNPPPEVVDSIGEVIGGRELRGYDEDGYLTKDDVQLESNFQFEGDWGLMEQFIRRVNERDRKNSNAYLERLQAIGFDEGFLEPERLFNDPGLEMTQEILARAKQEVDMYIQQSANLNDWILAEAELLEFSSKQTREDFLQGIKSSREETLGLQSRSLELEAEILSSMGNVVQALKSAGGDWWVEDGQPYFTYDEDIEAYNGAIDEMNAIIEEQEFINSQLRLKRLRKLEALRNLND